jgi:hypothetical protein
MAAFKIGINMAGAISAGAYTAGVLDFLIEALDQWEAAKQRGDMVPRHEVSLDVFSGASAGGRPSSSQRWTPAVISPASACIRSAGRISPCDRKKAAAQSRPAKSRVTRRSARLGITRSCS